MTPKCDKVRYLDQPAAEQALRRAAHAARKNKGKSRGVRSCYRCPRCPYWHLTSLPAGGQRIGVEGLR